jgi:hypothetical protein
VVDLPPGPDAFGLEIPWALAAPGEGRLLYRIVTRETPSVHDFLSKRDKRDRQMHGESWFLYVGLSMFAESSQAEAIRDRFKRDQHVAEVPLHANHGFMLARTRRTPGHYTVWGRPDDLLQVALDHQGYPGP